MNVNVHSRMKHCSGHGSSCHAGLRGLQSRQLCLHKLLCHVSRPGAQPSDGGDPGLQESLVDMLNLELAKAKIREDIRNDLATRKQSIQKIGQELTEEFEKKLELDKMRMELASSSSLADTLQQFKELDDEIQGIRDQLKADKKELIDFETRAANQRNDSLFFKSLHESPDNDDDDEGGQGTNQQKKKWKKKKKGSAATLDKEVVKQLTTDIKAPAVQEVHSPLRLYIFTYLALVLMYIALIDAGNGQPAPAQDFLYVILSVGLGWNAWKERKALSKAMDEEEDQ